MSGPDADALRQALKDVFDPELGYNIVDLGLIYGIEFAAGRASVIMTMTTPGCPAADMIQGGVHARLAAEPGVDETAVDVVWDPPWSPAMMSADAKAHFGIGG